MKKPVTVVSTSQYALVRKISELLKLGDDGKLDSFFTRVVKTLNTEIKGHKKNMEIKEFKFDQKIDAFKDSLQDAKEAELEAYLDIPVEEIATNAKQITYMDIYMAKLDMHAKDVSRIEDKIKVASDDYKEVIDNLKAEISSLEKRVKIMAKK